MHSVVGVFKEGQIRLFHQCNLAASDEPWGRVEWMCINGLGDSITFEPCRDTFHVFFKSSKPYSYTVSIEFLTRHLPDFLCRKETHPCVLVVS